MISFERAFNSRLVAGGVVLLVIASAVEVLAVLERQRPPSVRAEELSYLPKGEYLRVAVLGYQQIAADLIWLRAVQHLGEKRQSKRGYYWAYHVVDVVTDLDPKFVPAYQATGVVLGVWAGLLHESIAVLQKGMQHNPDVWQLPFFIGYDYFYELCDASRAAPYLQLAARLPGSPEYLQGLAARMAVEGGDPGAALEFLEQLYARIEDERLREPLAQKIRVVTAERDIRFLEDAVKRYRTRYGRRPAMLKELVSRGIIRRIPDEPLGGRYELTAEGAVVATGLRERMKLYRNTVTQGCKPRQAVPYTPPVRQSPGAVS
jgi:tetratricopeptide (TPR) repeat protein